MRIRIGVPPHGVGERIDQIDAWLDANCGADGWAMAPDGLHGVLNDAIAIYLYDATPAGAFVARWCAGYKVESADGAFQIREDAPTPRLLSGLPISAENCPATGSSCAPTLINRRGRSVSSITASFVMFYN